MRYSDPKDPVDAEWTVIEVEAPFTNWFTTDGHFIAKPFQQWLASSVPIIGKAAIANSSKQITTRVEDTTMTDLDHGGALKSRKVKS